MHRSRKALSLTRDKIFNRKRPFLLMIKLENKDIKLWYVLYIQECRKKQELAKDSNGILKRTLKSKNVMSEFLQNNLVRIEAD